MMSDTPETNGANPAEDEAPTEVASEQVPNKVVWDDKNMQTTFANVVNVMSTREEFALLFGTNQTWNLVGTSELTVRLSDRIVLTPHAAKRLQTLLAARLSEYEKRFGALNL